MDLYRHKFNKAQYRLSNWPSYNESLKSRGNLTIWFTPDIVKEWYYKSPNKKRPGRKLMFQFSNSYEAYNWYPIWSTIKTNRRFSREYCEAYEFKFRGSRFFRHYTNVCKMWKSQIYIPC